tara:strand:- start:2658 stop:2819 length:162 start_codon:yes stop_codon:yes gene_type:complete
MAKSYWILKKVTEDLQIMKTKRVGKKYVHFEFPNGLPIKILKTTYQTWNGGRS